MGGQYPPGQVAQSNQSGDNAAPVNGDLEKINDKEIPANADGHMEVWSAQTGSGAVMLAAKAAMVTAVAIIPAVEAELLDPEKKSVYVKPATTEGRPAHVQPVDPGDMSAYESDYMKPGDMSAHEWRLSRQKL